MLKKKIYDWLSKITQEGNLPIECKAIYIGLFENEEYMIHFLGSMEYDSTCDDWACQDKEDYFPKNRYLCTGISSKVDWNIFLNDVISIIKELKNDKSLILAQLNYIAVGFDSGDLINI